MRSLAGLAIAIFLCVLASCSGGGSTSPKAIAQPNPVAVAGNLNAVPDQAASPAQCLKWNGHGWSPAVCPAGVAPVVSSPLRGYVEAITPSTIQFCGPDIDGPCYQLRRAPWLCAWQPEMGAAFPIHYVVMADQTIAMEQCSW